MGPNCRQAVVKYGKVFVLVATLVIVLSEFTLACSGEKNKPFRLNCRIHIYHPHCRGVAAKRDTQSHTATIRFSPPSHSNDDNYGDYFMESQKVPSDDNYVNVNGLLGLLKRAISKNGDYDTGNNYLE